MTALDVYVNPLLTGNTAPYTRPATLLSLQQGTVTKKQSNPFNAEGCIVRRAYQVWNKGTETDHTIYRVFKDLPGNIIPIRILYAGTAIAGLSSVACGLYKTGLVIPGGPIGTVQTAGSAFAIAGYTGYGSGVGAYGGGCFNTGADLSAGFVSFREGVAYDLLNYTGGALVAFSGNPIVLGNTLHTRLFEYAGEDVTNREQGYDLCLVLNTGGANPGTMGLMLEYVQG